MNQNMNGAERGQAPPARKRMVLARLGEIALKGLNRSNFEQRLLTNLRRRLAKLGEFEVRQSESRVWLIPLDAGAEDRLEAALDVACSVFGLVSASLVTRYEALHSLDAILQSAVDYMGPICTGRAEAALAFKAEAKRGDKRLPYPSPELVAAVGAELCARYPQLRVDVREPELVLHLELRDALYIYHDKRPGLKGLPIGTSGKAMLLLSGGIDSPVAGFKIASRGVELEAVYFHTYPYTSDEAKQKVIDLARLLCDYIGRLTLHIVDFTDIQLTLRERCPEDMMTIVMRRMMMRIADALAAQRDCLALVTGESLGQVASQTTQALATTNCVSERPVFRPLIATDKDETIALARRIGTFETSILPYEDCCTVFVAKHPRTRPSLRQAEEAEQGLDIPALVAQGLAKIESLKLP